MRIKIGPEFQGLDRSDKNFQNCNVSKDDIEIRKDKIIIPVLIEIGPESQGFEG